MAVTKEETALEIKRVVSDALLRTLERRWGAGRLSSYQANTLTLVRELVETPGKYSQLSEKQAGWVRQVITAATVDEPLKVTVAGRTLCLSGTAIIKGMGL